jgi:anaerobic selenocysteine-containing dehydrogenase
MSIRRVYTTCTRDCPNTCGLRAIVENGRIVRLEGHVDHPFTRGRACAKAPRFLDRVYGPHRIVRPLRRSGESRRAVSWRDALDELAERIAEVRDRYGPEAVLYYQGYGARTALKLLNVRFFNHIGGATTLRGSLCGGTGQAAQDMDLGRRISHDPLDHLNARTVILWGRNPAVAHPGLMPILRRVRQGGGTVVLVDPRRTRTADHCDRHLAPRPGSDLFLALAAAKIVLESGNADEVFLRDRSEGFPAFRGILDRYSLRDLRTRCDVPLPDIEFLADRMIHGKPAAILLGWGLHRYENAHLGIRAIDALSAMTGNLGIPGGGVGQGFEEYGPYDPAGWGRHLAPPRRTFRISEIGREISAAKAPPIRLAFVTAGNPLAMAPDSDRVRRAFESVDFVVVAGHVLDDTAEIADLFLPVTTFLEERDLTAGFGHNYLGPVLPAIEPVGECRSDFDIFQALGRRFGLGPEYVRDRDAWLAELLAPVLAEGYELADLFAGPVRLDAPAVPYADGVFSTTSGRFRFLEALAPDPNDDTAEDPAFPFRLLTPVVADHIGSERTPTDHSDLPRVRIHPAAAEFRGLRDGDRVRVAGAVGALIARLRLDAGLRPDVAAMDRGGWTRLGHGVNRLTRDLTSRMGEGTPFFEARVNVHAIDADDPGNNAVHLAGKW